ncbi:MAG: transporter substrate-binding domain-containing protein, partial [Clostridium perfringens]|nr:transporter substrate-binding domain-containing protein [Clostridium perfringens]
TYAPFGFKDKDSGKLAGFDIDIINAIANEEGIEADIQNLNFDALLPALQSNTIDIAISDMTISEERAKSVDFSKPYYIAGNGLVVNIDNTNINSFNFRNSLAIIKSVGEVNKGKKQLFEDSLKQQAI